MRNGVNFGSFQVAKPQTKKAHYMATVLDFVLPANHPASVAQRFREHVSSDLPSYPESTRVITPKKWSCSEYKERIHQIASVVSPMQDWMNEAAMIEATSNVKPVGRKEIERFMKLRAMLETCIDLFMEVELPSQ